MTIKSNYSILSRKQYLKKRNQEVLRLRNSSFELNDNKLEEYTDTIFKSYEESTDVDIISRVKIEGNLELLGYRSIGIFQAIERVKFYATNYYWAPFFSDVGRAISRGERKYIHHRLGKHIRGVDETISYSKPDFSILGKYISKLREGNIKPNVMLAPIQVYAKFVKNYWCKSDKSDLGNNQIQIEGCDIQIVWSHKYAPLRSFIVFNSSAGIWHVLKDIDSERRLTVAMGESKDQDNKILFLVETMAYYEIINRDAFT